MLEKNCCSWLFSSPEQHKCSKGHEAGPAHSCASLPSAAWILAAVDKQGGLCYSGKLVHFDSRRQPVYTHPAGKGGFAGQGNHQTNNHDLPRRVPISSPCIHMEKANKCQHLKERVKWCFFRGLGMMTKQSTGLPLEILAHAQDHSTEASTYSSFITWASVEILVLSITAP